MTAVTHLKLTDTTIQTTLQVTGALIATAMIIGVVAQQHTAIMAGEYNIFISFLSQYI